MENVKKGKKTRRFLTHSTFVNDARTTVAHLYWSLQKEKEGGRKKQGDVGPAVCLKALARDSLVKTFEKVA